MQNLDLNLNNDNQSAVEPNLVELTLLNTAILKAIYENDKQEQQYINELFQKNPEKITLYKNNIYILNLKIDQGHIQSSIFLFTKIDVINYYLDYLLWKNKSDPKFNFKKIKLDAIYDKTHANRKFILDTLTEIAQRDKTFENWRVLGDTWCKIQIVETLINAVACYSRALNNYNNEHGLFPQKITEIIHLLLKLFKMKLMNPCSNTNDSENYIPNLKVDFENTIALIKQTQQDCSLTNLISELNQDELNKVLKEIHAMLKDFLSYPLLTTASFQSKYNLCIALKKELDSLNTNDELIDSFVSAVMSITITDESKLDKDIQYFIDMFNKIPKEQNQYLLHYQSIQKLFDKLEMTAEPSVKFLLQIKNDFNDTALDKLGIKGFGPTKGTKIPETVEEVRKLLQNISFYTTTEEAVVFKYSLQKLFSEIKLTNKQIAFYYTYFNPKNNNILNQMIDGRHSTVLILYCKTIQSLDITFPKLDDPERTTNAILKVLLKIKKSFYNFELDYTEISVIGFMNKPRTPSIVEDIRERLKNVSLKTSEKDAELLKNSLINILSIIKFADEQIIYCQKNINSNNPEIMQIGNRCSIILLLYWQNRILLGIQNPKLETVKTNTSESDVELKIFN